MSSIRDIKNYLDAEIQNVIKSPLYRAKNITLGKPNSPSFYQIESTKNTILEVSFDDRLYVIQYNRRNFMPWFECNLVPGQYLLLPKGAARTIDLLPLINKRWGFGFVEGDIVDTELTYKDVSGIKRAVVPISETNLWFTGQIEVPLLPTVQVVGKEAFPVEWDPRPLQVKNTAGDISREVMCASLLTYNHDYGPQSAVLSTITQQGSLSPSTIGSQASALTGALRAVDKLPWANYATAIAGGSAAYNLAGAFCLYNGPTEGYIFTPPIHGHASTYLNNSYHDYDNYVRKEFKNVLVIMLDSNNYCSNLNGLLFIHYGGASDVIDPVEYAPPVHYWPLRGTPINAMGGPDIAASILWHEIAGIGKMAKFTGSSTGYPIGTPLPVNRDFTLQISMHNISGSNLFAALFLSHPTTISAGALSTAGNQPIFHQGTLKWAAPALRANVLTAAESCTLTVVKKGNVYRCYVFGELVTMGEVGIIPEAWTHIYAQYWAGGNVAFNDLYYYDYAMSSDLVKKLARGVYGQP